MRATPVQLAQTSATQSGVSITFGEDMDFPSEVDMAGNHHEEWGGAQETTCISYDDIGLLCDRSPACQTYINNAIAGVDDVESRQRYVHARYNNNTSSVYLEKQHCTSVEFCKAFLKLNNPKSINIVSHGEEEGAALIQALVLYRNYSIDAQLNLEQRVSVRFADQRQITLTVKNIDKLMEMPRRQRRD